MPEQEVEFKLNENDRMRLRQIVDDNYKRLFGSKAQMAFELGVSEPTARKLHNAGKGTATTLQSTLEAFGVDKTDPLFQYLNSESRPKPDGLNAKIFIAIGVSIFVTLAATLAYLSEIFTSDRELARRELAAQNIALTPENVASYIATADPEILSQMTTAGVSVSQFEGAFYANAARFFESSKGKADALAWLKTVFSKGLNPELRVSDTYYSETALLFQAIRAGNAQAIVAILDAGGSPHPWVQLTGEHTDAPAILYPLNTIATYAKLSRSEKELIIDRMLNYGAVLYAPIQASTSYLPDQTGDANMISYSDGLDEIYRYTAQRARKVNLDESFERSDKLCNHYDKHRDGNWCEFVAGIPKVIENIDNRFGDFGKVIVQDMISVSADAVFFFATNLGGRSSLNGVLEVTNDRERYKLYVYGSQSLQSKTRCEGEWSSSNYCWHQYEIVRDTENSGRANENYEVRFHN